MSEHADARVCEALVIAMSEDKFIPETIAGTVGILRDTLAADDGLLEIFIYQVKDFEGGSHVCVSRTLPSCGLEAYRLDVPGMRREAAAMSI